MYLRISLLVLALVTGTLLTPIQALLVCICVLLSGLVIKVWLTRCVHWGWVAGVVLALVWACFFVTQQRHHRLPQSGHGESVNLSGCVTGIPQPMQSQLTGRTYLKFSLALDPNQLSPAGLRRVRLNWYAPDSSLQAGDCFRMTAVLRSPRNLANQLPFDYEAYLLFRGVDANGYVRSATRLDRPQRPLLRDRLLQSVNDGIPAPASVWIRGLVFGDGAAFSPQQWQLVRDTGTLHLLVVSGLHVGLMALAGFWCGRGLQRGFLLYRSGYLASRVALVPTISATLAATLYLYFAGAGIPLLRAWLMAVLGVLLFASARRFRPAVLLLLAIPGVLVINPLAWTQSGFWYSFAAVLALIAVFHGRKSGWIHPWLLPQLAIFLMLLPVSMFWGQPVSPVQMIANALAVPVLSLLLLPLTILCLLWPHPIMTGALAKLDLTFWWTLEHLQSLPSVELPSQGAVFLLMWGILMVVYLKGAQARLVLPGGLLLLVLMAQSVKQTPGIWLFDSGQGQSLLVTDNSRSVLIDTGASYSTSFSIAGAVVLPWMSRAGVTQLDLLIVSHSDHDHAGGVDEILNGVGATRVLAGQPQALAGSGSCHPQGRLVLSEHLYLVFFHTGQQEAQADNDASCVVQIHWYGKRLLVPGDITSRAEKQLIVRYGPQLQSDILIAGHHGSHTSSSSAWLKAVSPEQVWISAGYRNRFGHPHADVMRRLEDAQADVLVTADEGLIRLYPDATQDTARSGWQPPWRQ